MQPAQIIPSGALSSMLDLRSQPDRLQSGALRMRQNCQIVGDGKLRRGQGFAKLLDGPNYNNADFHDQMLAVSGVAMRQPITLLYEAKSSRKVRFLIAGTQSTIGQLNAFDGAWTILGSGFGGNQTQSAQAPRFKCSSVGDYVTFTNNFDKVKYMVLEQQPDNSGNYLLDLPDLATIGLTRAKVLWAWKNCQFLADVEMDGQRWGHRLLWSDYNKPISFDPAKLESITGSQDLYPHETILAGAPMGDVFIIYTTHGIWEMSAVGGDQSFAFRRIYDGESDKGSDTKKGILAYPNTLVNVHDGHAYIAHDGIYHFTAWTPLPERPEWVHRADYDLLTKIDANACDAHIAIVDGDELYFSVALTGALNQCPNYTLRLNKAYNGADVVDVGLTAATQFSPNFAETIRDFIIGNQICTLAGLIAAGYPYGKEGLPLQPIQPTSPFVPTCFYTTVTQTINGVVTEDWNQAHPDPHSLCALMGTQNLDEFCRTCGGSPLLVAASSDDWCLKQLNRGVFYREMCSNASSAGSMTSNGYSSSIGSYVQNPITSILRLASANSPGNLIELDQLEIKYLAVAQTPSVGVSLRIGISSQPADPNTGEGIVWFQHSTKPLQFSSTKTMAQHIADKTIPSNRLTWQLFRAGRFLHIELTIAGIGGDALLGLTEALVENQGPTINS